MRKNIAVIGLKGLPAFGGAAAVGENLIIQLSEKYDFTVYSIDSHISSDKSFDFAHQVIFKSFPVKSLNIFYYYLASSIHALIKGNYNLIHLHHIDGAFILFLLRLKYRVVSTSHGLTYKHTKWKKILHPYFKINEWIQCRLSNHITLVSKSLYRHYSQKTSINKITYIPNGVDIPEEHYLEVVDGSLVFSAGRIIPSKGLHIFLESISLLKTNSIITVIGDFDQLPAYKKEILDKYNYLNLRFLGLIVDKGLLKKSIISSQLFIFPSTYEAMSMMLLEVAALKVPIICADIEANTDVFSNSEVLFFKNNNSKDLSEKIKWAYSNMDKMKLKAKSAFEKVSTQFKWPTIAHIYDEVFNPYLKNKIK